MKTSTIILLCSLTSAVAFGLGWTMHPDSEDSRGEVSLSRADRSRVSRSVSASPSRGDSQSMEPEKEFISRYLVAGKISSEDIRAAMKEIANMNDPLLRQKMFASLLENLTAENAKAAFLELKENSQGRRMGRGGNDEMRLLANAWGRIDGPGAIAALQEIAAENGEEGGGNARGRGRDGNAGQMASVLAGWATVDGAAASVYATSLEDTREQRTAAFGVLQGMLVNGVDEAMGFIESLPATEDGDRSKGMYMAMVAGEMLEQGLDQAQGWVDTVTDPDLRTGALARVTMEMMLDDREAAAKWITQYADEEAAGPAVSRLADSWAREDPQAVMDWAEQLDGSAKAEAYQEAMESWAREDATAASEYLNDLAHSPERDAAVEGFATRVSDEDPVTAMEWAETIGDVSTRQDTMVEVARDWLRDDRVAAEEWIQSSGLPASAVEAISQPRRDTGTRRPGGRGR